MLYNPHILGFSGLSGGIIGDINQNREYHHLLASLSMKTGRHLIKIQCSGEIVRDTGFVVDICAGMS